MWGVIAFGLVLSVASGCKIAILEIENLPGAASCNSDQRFEGHMHLQHAQQYWINRAIKNSKYYTDDLEQADAVVVDDYCPLLCCLVLHCWYQENQTHTDGYNPKTEIASAYSKLMQLPRFKRLNGADFVFHSPFPLVTAGLHTCETLQQSMHIIVEIGQRNHRSGCLKIPKMKQLIVPYSSTSFEFDIWPERNISVFFLGTCDVGSAGMRIRRHLITTLHSKDLPSDTYLQCIDKHNWMDHDKLKDTLKRSVFCLVLPGDTASSRRLTEVILAGCIPVFVGPPWHTLPWSSLIDYTRFSIFVHTDKLMMHGEDTPRKNSILDVNWWTVANYTAKYFHRINNLTELIPLLQSVSSEELIELQKHGARVKSYFMYTNASAVVHSLYPTASDLVTEAICDLYAPH